MPKGHRTGSSQVRLRLPLLPALLGCPDTRTEHSTPDTLVSWNHQRERRIESLFGR
jgi:hypothetical protein